MVMLKDNVKAPDPEAVDAFVNEWAARSETLNWHPLWLDTETGQVVDFFKIRDSEELFAASKRAEAQYLQMIEERRHSYADKFTGPARKTALVQFERGVCEQELYYLVKFVLGRDKLVFHLHYFVAKSVEDLGTGARELRELPRDTYKTTIMGEGKAIQLILRDPNIRIAYISQSKDNAGSKVSTVRDFFMGNQTLKALYPQWCPARRADEGSSYKWTTPARTSIHGEATITALGTNSRSSSQHFCFIICDDFWDENSVTSAEQLTKTEQQFNKIDFLLQAPAQGIILFIGTRFSHDDLTSIILEHDAFHCVIVSGITPNGRSLFPEYLTVEFMYKYANGGKSEQGLYQFSCQIMLSPTTASMGFQRSWFVYRSYSELRQMEMAGETATRKVIVCDAAVDDEKTSDHIAILCLAIDHHGNIWVLDYIRERMEPSKFVTTLFAMGDKWRPEFIARQKTSLETTLMSFIRDRQEEREKEGLPYIPFYDYSLHKRKKKGRITNSLQPRFQARLIIFCRELQGLLELEDQLLKHPNTQEDDGPDALSMVDDPKISAPADFKPFIPIEETPPPSTKDDYREMEMADRRARCREGVERIRNKNTRSRRGSRRNAGKVWV